MFPYTSAAPMANIRLDIMLRKASFWNVEDLRIDVEDVLILAVKDAEAETPPLFDMKSGRAKQPSIY